MQMITIGCEFGSGERKLDKKMSDMLSFSHYGKIITAVLQESKWNKAYIYEMLAKPTSKVCPTAIWHIFFCPAWMRQNEVQILIAWQRVIKSLAKKWNCVVTGQVSGWILREFHHLKSFVYVNALVKIKRCKKHASQEENFTNKELKNKIIQIDAGRVKRYEMASSSTGAERKNHHLCNNTTDIQIKTLAPQIVEILTLGVSVAFFVGNRQEHH